MRVTSDDDNVSGARWTARSTSSVAQTRVWPSQNSHRLRVYKLVLIDKLSRNFSSHFHLSPFDCDDRHQLLHLSQARDEGDGQGRGGLRRLQTRGQGSPGLQHGQE